MGWIFKGLLAVLALMLFGAGAWGFTLVIAAYLLFSFRSGRKRAGCAVISAGPSDRPGPSGARAAMTDSRGGGVARKWVWMYLLGGLLFLAALIGVGEHGTFSPLVFGGLGLVCLSLGRLSRSGRLPAASFTPVTESTLLRSFGLPSRWLTVVELKLSTEEAARALSVLRDNLVVVALPSERPRAYLLAVVTAVGYSRAEVEMTQRLRRLGATLANRGAYIMPLDSKEAALRFAFRAEPLKMDLRNDTVLEAAGHYPYDVIVVEPDGLYAKAMGAYAVKVPDAAAEVDRLMTGQPGPTTPARTSTGRAVFPSVRQSFERRPILWEVISSLQERFHLSDPDGYTTFLNTMHVSRNVPVGHKLNLAGAGATVTVESLGGAPVEMTRAQLRSVARIYG